METTNAREPQLTYAIDKVSGRMVSIECVDNGLTCNCICPKCRQTLIAKNEGKVRQKHFAHQGEYGEKVTYVCHGYYMSALHRLAEQIIRDHKSIMAPAYNEMEARSILFTYVEVEERKDRADLQPDIVGITEDGHRCLIEIRNTSKIDQYKKKKIIDSGLICMEIDVRDIPLENLEDFLLNSSERREWINNPEYEKVLREMMARVNTGNIADKNTSNGRNAANPINNFYETLKTNNCFIDYNGIKTSVINYGKTASGNNIVIFHGDNSAPWKLYLTLVTFSNGMPNYFPCREFDDMEIAEKAFAKIKERY